MFGGRGEFSPGITVKIAETIANTRNVQILEFKIVPLVTENERPIQVLLAVVLQWLAELED